jgi:hypothetical protein
MAMPLRFSRSRTLLRVLAAVALPLWTGGSIQAQATTMVDASPPLALSRPFEGRPSPAQIVEIGGGRIILFFRSRDMQLQVLDSALSDAGAVRTAAGEPFRYGNRGGALLKWLGDSAIFTDATNLTNVVIRGDGVIAGERAVPRPADPASLAIVTGSQPPIADGFGSIVYTMPSPTSVPLAPESRVVETHALVRVQIATRRLDTVAILERSVALFRNTAGVVERLQNPVATADDWTVLPDGTIATISRATMVLHEPSGQSEPSRWLESRSAP